MLKFSVTNILFDENSDGVRKLEKFNGRTKAITGYDNNATFRPSNNRRPPQAN